MIVDMLSNKTFNSIVSKLIIRGRKLNIPIVFITQSYFAEPKNIRVNCTHCFILRLQTNKNFNKLHLIIHHILTLNIF